MNIRQKTIIRIRRIETKDDAQIEKLIRTCLIEFDGVGLAQQMLDIALDFAKEHYNRCYLESFANMLAAHAFYKRNGFDYIDYYVGNTGHHACEIKMIKDL